MAEALVLAVALMLLVGEMVQAVLLTPLPPLLLPRAAAAAELLQRTRTSGGLPTSPTRCCSRFGQGQEILTPAKPSSPSSSLLSLALSFSSSPSASPSSSSSHQRRRFSPPTMRMMTTGTAQGPRERLSPRARQCQRRIGHGWNRRRGGFVPLQRRRRLVRREPSSSSSPPSSMLLSQMPRASVLSTLALQRCH